MTQPNKNPPKFFFNFIGPESDDQDYMPVTPKNPLTHSVPAKTENPKRKEFGVTIRQNVESRADMLKRKLSVSGRQKRVGSDPSLLALEEEATAKKQKTVEVDPDSPVAGLVAKGEQPFGSGSRGQTEIVMPEWMKSIPDWMREMWRAAKMKANEEKGKEKSAQESDTSKTIIKGVIKKADDGRVNILCTCHDHAHTAEEFINHAGGGGSPDQTRFVIISSDNP